MRFLRQFQKNGTILFVSHDLAAVTAFCDQAIWLENGIIRDAGTAKDVCEKYFAQIYMQHSAGGTSSVAVTETDESTEKPKQTVEPKYEIVEQRVAQRKDKTLPPGTQHIESFGFNFDSASFGTGDAKITGVEFTDSQGHELAVCEGGQEVIVRIIAHAINDINMPILGFTIKDRLGQHLIGGNTFHAYKDSPIRVDGGNYLKAEFHFKLPILAIGDYSIVAAIANGTLQEHVQLHWLHDAALFKVIATSIDGVIVGAPLDKIVLTSVSGV
jgi:lipopolysaccharide transport system ATP-binding protein